MTSTSISLKLLTLTTLHRAIRSATPALLKHRCSLLILTRLYLKKEQWTMARVRLILHRRSVHQLPVIKSAPPTSINVGGHILGMTICWLRIAPLESNCYDFATEDTNARGRWMSVRSVSNEFRDRFFFGYRSNK